MANPHRGEVAFSTEDGATYTLKFSVDALCALEEAVGKGIVAISIELSDPEKLSMGLLRKVLWAGLRHHHPDVDVKAAGELIVGTGGIEGVIPVISEALEAAFQKGDKKRSPQKPGR